jgi:hypothetical protein
LPKVVKGVRFQNGIEVIEMPAHHAAWSTSSPNLPHSSRATDARIKRLYAAEAERWLRLTELKRRVAESDSGGLIAAE